MAKYSADKSKWQTKEICGVGKGKEKGNRVGKTKKKKKNHRGNWLVCIIEHKKIAAMSTVY